MNSVGGINSMDSLIKIINKLQDVFAVVGGDNQNLNLPQIVVVGTQSSGKSSVLESLVGKSFLPRGTGVVTRAPLVIQMIKYTDEERELAMMSSRVQDEDVTEWAQFLHKPKTLFFDFDDVRDEIDAWTDHLAGDNKGITNEQIVLKVYTRLYDLTFVDLPGITKVAVGDQPEDIDEQIHKLIMSYVKQSNSIILAVVPANTDPSTCECLQIAKKLDPDGSRTIAVVTKLDLIDDGTLRDTTELLMGKRIPVKLGIVGVVNRSQKDTVENKSIHAALASESDFLKKYYPEIHNKHGNKALARTLQSVLIAHIKNAYPELKDRLEDMKEKLEQKLLTLNTPDNTVSFIIRLLKDISKSYERTVNGDQDEVSMDRVTGGACISDIFQQKYLKKVNAIDPFLDLTNENVANVLLNTAGVNTSAFVNEKALQQIVSRQLKNLVEPSLYCVDSVRNEMLKILDSIDVKLLDTLKRFPELNRDVRMVFSSLLEENVNSIKEFIESYIESYRVNLNTSNPDFISEVMKSNMEFEVECVQAALNDSCRINGSAEHNQNSYSEFSEVPTQKEINVNRKRMLTQLLSGIKDEDESLELSEQVKLHRELSCHYFNFVRKIVRDFVPKRIKHKLINSFVEQLDSKLNENIFQKYLLENKINTVLLREDENFQEDRQDADKKLAAVKQALNNMIDIQYF